MNKIIFIGLISAFLFSGTSFADTKYAKTKSGSYSKGYGPSIDLGEEVQLKKISLLSTGRCSGSYSSFKVYINGDEFAQTHVPNVDPHYEYDFASAGITAYGSRISIKVTKGCAKFNNFYVTYEPVPVAGPIGLLPSPVNLVSVDNPGVWGTVTVNALYPLIQNIRGMQSLVSSDNGDKILDMYTLGFMLKSASAGRQSLSRTLEDIAIELGQKIHDNHDLLIRLLQEGNERAIDDLLTVKHSIESNLEVDFVDRSNK